MTVTTTTSRQDYTANGVTTAFSFNFRTLLASDLVVMTTDDDGVVTTYTIDTDYTVSGAGSETGGTVTFLVAPASGLAVAIVRELPFTQPTDYKNQDSFYAFTHEKSFDRATMLIQQNKQTGDRSLKVPLSETTAPSDLPTIAARSSKYLAFDASGNPVAQAGTGVIVDASASGALDITPAFVAVPGLTTNPVSVGTALDQQAQALYNNVNAASMLRRSFDAGYATSIGGYPITAELKKADGSGYWISTIDANSNDPDAGGAGWESVELILSGSNLTPTVSYDPVPELSGLGSEDVNSVTKALANRSDYLLDQLNNVIPPTIDAAVTAAEAAAASADVSAQAAQNTKGLYPTTTDALSNGVAALASVVAGSGGTDGTFDLTLSGGAGSKAAGRFVVAGGAVVSTIITYPGYGYTSAPTVSFAASTGLTGASATAVLAQNVTDGQYFNIPDSADSGVTQLWQNVSGVATDTGERTASGALVSDILDHIGESSDADDIAGGFADGLGFLNFASKKSGAFGTENIWLDQSDDYLFAVVDGLGFVAISDESKAVAETQTQDSDLVSRNATNLALSAARRDEINTECARPIWDYNIALTYGQSLSTGWEGWPALSKIAMAGLDNLMVGESPRPNSRTAAYWTAVGTAAFNPLVAVTQATSTGCPVMSDAAVSALSPGATNEGETSDVGAANMWRKMQLQFRGVSSDASRKLVVVNCGVNGKTVEELSKGASPNLYQRVIDAITQVKTLADGEGKSCGIVSISFLQGEYNYDSSHGGTQDKDTYKALCAQLYDDIVADCATGICGQDSPPAMFTYQTSGSWVRDDVNLSISTGQLEMCDEQSNWYLATASSDYTDKGGHLDSNGYRWMGMQFGKVMHRVIDRGQGWAPLRPRRITVSGTLVRIDHLVWAPPLQFRDTYVGRTATMYANKGYRCTDDNGDVAISSVTISADTVVDIRLAAAPVGQLYVWYKSQTASAGNGNLFDSDSMIACCNYEYNAGSGQYTDMNLPELVGKPYPLNNPCVAYRIAAEVI